MSAPHPMQPIVRDAHGVYRFKENAIVRHVLDAGPIDMNRLAVTPFTQEDRAQFAQLIGYSVSGAGDLGYMPAELIEAADAEVARMMAVAAGGNVVARSLMRELDLQE